MKRTELGNSGLTISRIVFGSMGRGTLNITEQLRVLHAAIDADSTSIDTAPLYEFGEVERTVGRAIKGRRDQVEVLSKVGLRWDDSTRTTRNERENCQRSARIQFAEARAGE